MFLTIYTPLYNKSETVFRTFQSLLNQTKFDFEWIIINDGSTDESGKIAECFKTDKFKITYISKENEGLSSAMNIGAELACGDYILRLDPDDYLDVDAVKIVYDRIFSYKKNSRVGCFVFLTKDENGQIKGFHPFSDTQLCNFWDYRHKYKALGDRAEVFVSSLYKKFRMPQFEKERFCPESILWNNFSDLYDAVYFCDAIYIREYNKDSITSSWPMVGYNNPKGMQLALSDALSRKLSFKESAVCSINYYRYSLKSDYSLSYLVSKIKIKYTVWGLIPGLCIYLFEIRHIYLIKKIRSIFRWKL